MTEDQVTAETLDLAVLQLRRAWNLVRMGQDEDLREACDLILAASNTVTTALWITRGRPA